MQIVGLRLNQAVAMAFMVVASIDFDCLLVLTAVATNLFPPLVIT